MLGAVLSLSIGGGAVATAWRYRAAVLRVAPPEPDDAVRSLASGDTAAVEALVTELGRCGLDDSAIAGALLGSGASAVAACHALDEHLGDVAAELASFRDTGRQAARLAATAGTLGAVIEALSGMRAVYGMDAAGSPWVWAVGAFAAGGLSALAAWEVVRRADARADSARLGWDRVASAILRALPKEPSTPLS